jgi:hypothetical protein
VIGLGSVGPWPVAVAWGPAWSRVAAIGSGPVSAALHLLLQLGDLVAESVDLAA